MTSLQVVALYFAFAAFFLIFLSVRVVRERRRAGRALLGLEGDTPLARAIRTHGNFVEYASIFMLALLLLALMNTSTSLLHGLGIVFFFGRILHAYSISVHEPRTKKLEFRITGMILTFTSLSLAGLLLLLKAFS